VKYYTLLLLICCLLLLGCAAPLSFEIAYVPAEEIVLSPKPAADPPAARPLPTATPEPTPEPLRPDLAKAVYSTCHELTEEDIDLAARVAYWEARGKGEKAYRAVLSVIYNRCMAPRFGGGMTRVETEVFRPGQFSVIHIRGFDSLEPPEEIVAYARDIFTEGNISLPYDVLFFCAEHLGIEWRWGYYGNIGRNLFFQAPTDRIL